MFPSLDDKQFSNWVWYNYPGNIGPLYDHPYNSTNEDLSGIGAAWEIKTKAGATGQGTVGWKIMMTNGAILIALKAIISPASVTINPPALSISTILVGGNLNLTATRNWNSSWTGGNGNFIYTWSSTGPASVTFTPNNANITGTSSATNATGFSVAGTYTIICTVQEQGGGLTKVSLSKKVNVLAAAPTAANLWATSSNGTQISHFVVSSGTYFSGPTNDFAPTFGGDGGTTSTAALGKSAAPNAATGHFYYLPNTSGNSGSINIYGATYNGGTINVVGNVDANGAGGGSLGFVRLAMGIDGRGWILAGDGSTVYLSKFTPGATPTAGSATTSTEDVDGVTLVGGSAATFQNGDICLSGNGTIFALANNGSGVTQIFRGTPNGNSTILTKVFDLVDNTGVPFSGRVNGVAFDLLGSLYISTDLG
ncbi:MAG: hypothetical protein IPQ06_06565 [Chitinophagaceae bacterium]|nr:hypothetical protein [Chitinophagaceae bacterium]